VEAEEAEEAEEAGEEEEEEKEEQEEELDDDDDEEEELAEDEAGSDEPTYSNSTPLSSKVASSRPPNVTLVGLSKRCTCGFHESCSSSSSLTSRLSHLL
jgi:hypothetical protein